MYNFNALLSRMKYIPRWSLMRQSITEDIAQHTCEVMTIAHTLCGIANNIYNKDINGEKIVIYCLYHDISEILTGDMPTPVKYNDEKLKKAYKNIEQQANSQLLKTQQPQVQDYIAPYLNTSSLTDYEQSIIKAADKLSALIKCIEELKSGNNEFKSAYSTIYSTIRGINLEEVQFFLENMIPSYNLCLDELAKIGD